MAQGFLWNAQGLGKVHDVFIPVKPEGKPRGFAFVRYYVDNSNGVGEQGRSSLTEAKECEMIARKAAILFSGIVIGNSIFRTEVCKNNL
ncbi:hypothetical protein BB560_001377 [Smittium megazygosporum]|uniref:RRM domain-containing protein n=1 Tax=Smittium megazygosporum TaxID=133381 RepID=A0A2T9ZHP1_9FUNG|nr:hypothetical protein BB560_001377 [Smittium megazygosporum]